MAIMLQGTGLDPVAYREAMEVFRHLGNPFRNHFARNSDDDSCGRFHVPELYSRERGLLLSLIDQFRSNHASPAEVLPILGNKGAGKTHLLHSIKHGESGKNNGIHLLVTPGSYQRDADFLEYLFFQVIDTLLGGGRHGRERPLLGICELVVARSLAQTLSSMTTQEKVEFFPPPMLGRWLRSLGLGTQQAEERCGWLVGRLTQGETRTLTPGTVTGLCVEAGIPPDRAAEVLIRHAIASSGRSTQGMMRAAVIRGLAGVALKGDEGDLASFLTYGFAELDFHVRPSRQDLVLSLFKALLGILREVRVPVFVAFDQLEDLLLARRGEDVHKVAESFFAGIVQCMHQLQGIGFLLFAERGLWNRFVPSLDGYMRDRLTNPVHLPGKGTIQALRLDPPPPELVRMVVEARLRALHSSHGCFSFLPACFPFQLEQIDRIARTEATLRDMLQQFRQLFDALVFGQEEEARFERHVENAGIIPDFTRPNAVQSVDEAVQMAETAHTDTGTNRIIGAPGDGRLDKTNPEIEVRSVVQLEVPLAPVLFPVENASMGLGELWDLEMRAAARQLEPEGAVAGATRELQSGLGMLLRLMNDHGVRVGPWRLQHVVEGFDFGEHPTYGVISIGHWACQGGKPWRVGIGLFLGRGQGKPKDLGVKFQCLHFDPSVVDQLILLRPEDDMVLQGKTKQLWQEMEKNGQGLRLEPLGREGIQLMYALPRIFATASEARPSSGVASEIAGVLGDRYEAFLRQLCMPVLDT